MSNDQRRNFEKAVRAAVPKYSETRGKAGVEAFGTEAMAVETAPLAVARNRDAPPEERVAELHALAPRLRNDEEFVRLLLELAGDTSESPELRAAVLRILRQLRFSSVLLNENRAAYIETLQPIIDDPDATLRQDALEMLAQQKDEYVQRRLVESLTTEAPPLGASLEKTIQLLGYDVHADHYPVLRDIAKTAPGAKARREAVRLLASDPESAGLLREIFHDKQEAQEVRRASANAYRSLDPAGFEQAAKNVVLDPAEDDDVRAACLTALTHFVHPSARDETLNRYVDELETGDLSKPFKDAVRTYKSRKSD